VVSLEEAPTGSARFEDLLAMILSGMMIFFVFFTGTSTAQSLLDEQENGTLQRLFTMPMGPRVILRGKFIYIAVMIIVQMAVLLVLGRWVFDIHWGSWWQLMIFILVCTAASGSFGLFLMSLMRDSRQAGMIYGGALTVTGMLAMMPSFTGGTNQTAALERAALFVPQGWALRVLNQVRDGVSFEAVLLSLGGLLLWAVVFYVIARRRLERRFL
ncbi:MAG: ABC transporter permease, partial [Anaerolineaceae bacterium]|nr:ABC transporter permease [Anaerolineaceae bacterium]